MFIVIIFKLKNDYILCFEDLGHKSGSKCEAGKNIGDMFCYLLSSGGKKLILARKRGTDHEELKNLSKEPLALK